nr:unnamed protein product [Callosobruchus analis]
MPLGANNVQSDRIVGGYDVGYYRYPWFAALIRYNEVSCGGALIGPRTVVTAAHCYKEFLTLASKGDLKLESIYNVKLGVYNICTTETIQREYRIEKVEVHELYNQKKPYYDICLLTLANETHSFQPICLPQSEIKQRPKDGYVPGLGTLRYKGAMPCTVHEARLLIFNDSDCLTMINKTGNDIKSFKNAFCAGYTQGGIDTCQGDSGGPLQIQNEKGIYVLLGVVSYGFRCAAPGMLGIYTDVSKYLGWIQEKSGLDAGVVNLIYNSTSPITARPTKASHKPRPQRRPLRKPIRIIIY